MRKGTPSTPSPVAQVGINAQLLSGEAGYRRAGIHQYIAQLLAHLPPQAEMRYLAFTGHDAPPLPNTAVTAVASRWPTHKRIARILWEQTVWPWLAWRKRLALLHSMAFVTPIWAPCPTVTTVYDLSFMRYPTHFPKSQRYYLASQTGRSCRQARRVITISEASRQDVHQFFGVPLAQIDVVYPGVDSHYRPYAAAEVAAFRQQLGYGRYLLHVGTLQPRKNIPLLLQAFAQLDEPELQLVLIGGKGWLYDEIFAQVQALGLADRVHFPGYVADEALPLWYNAAELLLFPSLYEGFGMPIIEAMACGTPVIGANNSSIPEAIGTAGLLFDPTDAQALAKQITAVLHDPQLSAKMRSLGLAHAQQFSWERAGRETAVVYRRALGA